MKIEIKWTEVMSEGQPCELCADDCSFRYVVEYREGEPNLATCSLGIGVATNVVEGLKPTYYCPGPGVYVREDGIKGLVGAAEYLLEQASDAIDKGKGSAMPAMLQLSIANLGAAMLTLRLEAKVGPFDVVVTVPEPQPDSQGKMIVYKCPVNAIECLWTHQNGFGGNINWCVPGPGCPRHPDAPIMEDRGRMVEPFAVVVEALDALLCKHECEIESDILNGGGRGDLRNWIRDVREKLRDIWDPRHPDHGKVAEQGGEG